MNNDSLARIFKLETSINEMVIKGKRNPDEVADILQSILQERQLEEMKVVPSGQNRHILDWQKFYEDMFGWKLDFSQTAIPAKRRGFGRVIIVAKEITLNSAFAKCKELFPCWSYCDDLDKAIMVNERTSVNGPYAIRVRNRVEADQELKNLSANSIASQKLATMTLLERVVFELKWFKETGQHLDIQNITLCSGSRVADGHAPRARWSDGRFEVHWCRPGFAYGFLRPRAVVSC